MIYQLFQLDTIWWFGRFFANLNLSDYLNLEMWWLILFGIIVLGITSYDILWTILSASEAGSLSYLIMRFYKGITRFFPRHIPFTHNIIRSIGLFSFLTSILVWFILFWLGWSLIFVAVETSIISSYNLARTGVIEKVYYIGYMIFTAGLGDYKPVGSTFQILSVLANATGIILVTITIAYLLSATGAVMRQRQMAGHISAIGSSPIAILINAWNGKDFRGLEKPLSAISRNITVCAQQLLRFPLIFNFHSIEKDYSPTVRLATLDELVTIIECGLPPHLHIDKLVLVQCRKTVDQFLSASEKAIGIHFDSQYDVPIPSLENLERNGLPLVPHHQWRFNIQRNNIIKRRRLLYKIVVDSSRQWSEVYGDG
jgi:hypothetical protein